MGPAVLIGALGWEYESLVSLSEVGRPLVLRRHQHSTRGRPSTNKNTRKTQRSSSMVLACHFPMHFPGDKAGKSARGRPPEEKVLDP